MATSTYMVPVACYVEVEDGKVTSVAFCPTYGKTTLWDGEESAANLEAVEHKDWAPLEHLPDDVRWES